MSAQDRNPARRLRLADKLRENLARRKRQARQRAGKPENPAPKPAGK